MLFFLVWFVPAGAMTLTSPDIRNGGALGLEQDYPRCGGRNISPRLAWNGVPKTAKSLVLTMIDTSVKPNGWSHWVVVDMPPQTSGLAKGAPAGMRGAVTLVSDFGDARYNGPCPPKGTGEHRYEFAIWALPFEKIPLHDGSAKLRPWLSSHALDKAVLVGRFGG